MNVNERIAALRRQMKSEGIDVWIEPTADPHQSEYLAPRFQTRKWLTGFTGSAGTVVVTADKAVLWADSRYWIQAADQIEGTELELMKLGAPGVPVYSQWIADKCDPEAVVGFYGAVFSCKSFRLLQEKLADATFRTDVDLMDRVWEDRPALPVEPVALFDAAIAGETRVSKINRLQARMAEKKWDVCIVTALDDVAWLFNIRGADVTYNPTAYAWGAVTTDGAWLFIDANKVSDEVAAALRDDGVNVVGYDEIWGYLADIPEGARVQLAPAASGVLMRDSLPEHCEPVYDPSPIAAMKTIKNSTEIEGIRASQVRDGVALVRFFHWFEQNVNKTELNEHTVGEKLTWFRSQGERWQGRSFHPIVAWRGNGAQCHYGATAQKHAVIEGEGILLIDSGAQYLDGTTDITRTIAIGEPTDEQRRHNTLVLMAHIELASAVFPRGTCGRQLDAICRAPMWREQLNYGHGTGHGVGFYMNVHEGPQGISGSNAPTTNLAFQPGMLTSNEPGLYLEDRYGIRIENLILCEERGENDMGVFYGFETVTLCPIDRKLIVAAMLTPAQRQWLNDYHQRVREALSPHLDDAERAWLTAQTEPV